MRAEPRESPVYVQGVFTERNFDTVLVPYCNGSDPEIGVRRMFVSSSIGPVPFSNAAAYRNPEMDALFERAGASLDLRVRAEAYRRVQEIALRDLPYIALVESEGTRAHNARCSGFDTSAHFAAHARCDS